VKRRASKGTIWLFDDNNIDCAGESRGIDLIIEETEIADDLSDIVHTVHVPSPRTTGRGTLAAREHNQLNVVRNS